MNNSRINGFADIHTHILPYSDDGAKDMEQAGKLMKMAWESGTRTLVLTPHCCGEYIKSTPDQLRRTFDEFCRGINAMYPGMELHLGSEVFFQTEVPERLTEGQLLTLCGSRYVLLEFRRGTLRSQIIMAISETVRHGFIPVIAHAERYAAFREYPDLLDEVLEMGALIQLNADSVMGKCGFGVKRFCHRVLKRQCAHFIASDAHDAAERPPLLRKCYLHVHKKYGAEYAARLFERNARAVIEDKSL